MQDLNKTEFKCCHLKAKYVRYKFPQEEIFMDLLLFRLAFTFIHPWHVGIEQTHLQDMQKGYKWHENRHC